VATPSTQQQQMQESLPCRARTSALQACYSQQQLCISTCMLCCRKLIAVMDCMQVLAHGKAVLGYAVLGPVALLLVAEAVRVSAVLPGGHQIKTVTQSRWHRINLQVNTGCV